MAVRILVADDALPVLSALRRALEPAGYEVEAVPLSAVPEPGACAVAVVRGTAAGAALTARLRAASPPVPVVALFHDEDEATQHAAGPASEGLLVGPLVTPAVVGAVRAAEALARASEALRRRADGKGAAERSTDAEPGAGGGRDLEFLKRMLLLEVRRSKRYRFPVSLALVAVDDWAALSAGLGAAGSTALLSELLGLLVTSLRDIDLAVPFGEDRFVLLLPHTPPDQALGVARRLLRRLRDRKGHPLLSASAGVAGHAGEGSLSFGALVKQAAAALSQARAQGGDRAEMAGAPRPKSRISMG